MRWVWIFYTHLMCPEFPWAMKTTGHKLGNLGGTTKTGKPNQTNDMLIQNDNLPVRQNGFKS